MLSKNGALVKAEAFGYRSVGRNGKWCVWWDDEVRMSASEKRKLYELQL